MPSDGWKNILFGRELLVKRLKKKIGNGKTVNLWTDLWIEDVKMKAPLIKNCIIDICLTVNQLIDFRSRNWKRRRLEELFYQENINLILKMKPIVSRKDFWLWKQNKNGEYSVKSGYWLAHKEKTQSLSDWLR